MRELRIISMSKHKWHDMIVAKAANMHLVTLIKFGDEWMVSAPHETGAILTFDDRYEYFLCIPKHKEACLHWLNGGEIQNKDNKGFYDCTLDVATKFDANCIFMNVNNEIRIKPKKEKRWIAVDATTGQCTRHYSTKDGCFNSEFSGCAGNASGWQFIEIEVEV